MKSKFNIGDKVKLIRVHMSTYLSNEINKMKSERLGKTGIIKRGWRISETEFQYEVEGVGKMISSYDLELVEAYIKKPKYKIGDYVFYDGIVKQYIKIVSITKIGDGIFVYNFFSPKNYIEEKDLRLPTKKELELYFR